MRGSVLLLYIHSDTVWTGGRLMMSLVRSSWALRLKAPVELLQFESA